MTDDRDLLAVKAEEVLRKHLSEHQITTLTLKL